jgi:hypothetical protein
MKAMLRRLWFRLTKKLQLAIGEDGVASLAPATNPKSSSILRWCPKSLPVVAAQESRWWIESDEDD